MPERQLLAIRFRNWIKLGGSGDYWVFVTQPPELVDDVFAVEAHAASLTPPPS